MAMEGAGALQPGGGLIERPCQTMLPQQIREESGAAKSQRPLSPNGFQMKASPYLENDATTHWRVEGMAATVILRNWRSHGSRYSTFVCCRNRIFISVYQLTETTQRCSC